VYFTELRKVRPDFRKANHQQCSKLKLFVYALNNVLTEIQRSYGKSICGSAVKNDSKC